MNNSNINRTLTISTVTDFDKIRDDFKQVMKNQIYSSSTISEISICFKEMTINAIVHGNKNDPSKQVVIIYNINPEQVKIVIEDQGPGFNPSSLEDPTDIERLKDAIKNNEEDIFMHGRGIFLTRKYMDEVFYNDKGNQVTIIKRFS